MDIQLIKNRSTLAVTPVEPVLGTLMQELQFKRVEPRYGEDAIFAKSAVKLEQEILYQYTPGEPVLYTFAGLLDRVHGVIKRLGHRPIVSEPNPLPRFEPRFEALSGIDLREAQARMLAVIATCDYGQLNGITGVGKSVLIQQACRLYPYEQCRIVVCAQQKPIVAALRRGLEKYFPGHVGQVGGGQNRQCRITVATARSLRKVDPDKIHLLLYDEVHTAAGRDVSKTLMRFCNSRMFGLSASTECRTDRADLLVEAMFGPVRTTVDLLEGQTEGYIPPVEAWFYRFWMPEILAATPTARKREAVWRNEPRNHAVAQVVRHWESKLENPQILVMTDALEHVLFLRRHLPDYEIIFASAADEQINKFRELGILYPGFRKRTDREHLQLIRRFETGELRKVISTTTLGVGVDAPGLDVFVRADGGSSEISNIQFRGRVTRGERGIYCDFMIQGDEGEERRSLTRVRSARSAGWPTNVSDLPYE